MDPYLWTWLARYGGACALVAVWSFAAIAEGVRGEYPRAGIFGVLAAGSAALLGTCVVPLVSGGDLPRDPWALEWVLEAPYLAFALLALFVRPVPGEVRFDLLTLAPVALWSHGAMAWLLAAALVGRGLLMAGQVRGWILTGLFLLTLATLADAHRLDLRAVALSHGFGFDDASRVAAAVVAALELAGWTAATSYVLRSSDRGTR
jgi:hypothetical protein